MSSLNKRKTSMSDSSQSSSSSPSKKQKIVVHVQAPDPSKDPIVASFPGGLPRGLINSNDNDSTAAAPPKFVWRKSRDRKNSHKQHGGGTVLVGKDDTCLYQAQSQGQHNNNKGRRKQLTKLCVGVYNKRTGTLTLHQAAQNGTVFALSQTVRSYKEHSTSEGLPAQMSGADRRRELFESFGSSKKQKVLKSQAANVVNVDSVIGAGNVMMGAFLGGQNMSESNRQALERAKSGTKEDAVELAYAQARRKFLPTFDVTAKEPHLVYDARAIAGDDAWGQVSRVTDACLAQDKVVTALTSRGQWCVSVRGVLTQHIVPDSPYAKYQIKCAILLNHMIHFQQRVASRRFIRGSAEEAAKYLKMPMEIATRFLELFTTSLTDGRGQGFAASKQSKDKLLVHIFLLFLMAHGRGMKASNIQPVASDVKIELSEAANLLRAAGCTVKIGNNNTTASAALTVPLKFPPPKRGRGGPK